MTFLGLKVTTVVLLTWIDSDDIRGLTEKMVDIEAINQDLRKIEIAGSWCKSIMARVWTQQQNKTSDMAILAAN